MIINPETNQPNDVSSFGMDKNQPGHQGMAARGELSHGPETNKNRDSQLMDIDSVQNTRNSTYPLSHVDTQSADKQLGPDQLGTPTWFCSFSAEDRRWPEICEAICKQQCKIQWPDTMDWITHCSTFNSNPVTACGMFEHRVLNFIYSVILSAANPIGHVSDFFYRTEFQSRGWPHTHCLLWCKNAQSLKPE